MQDVTLSPAMGHYLDMVNNDKPNPSLGTHANENYARELMQLFTTGTSLINDDGSLQLDSSGNPIPTYSQDDVQAFARAYTGWTYPTAPGATAHKHNAPYWIGPMVPWESNHDTDTKQLLQYSGAASGGTPCRTVRRTGFAGALDNIFNHPNVPAFVSLRLIEHLVTSNPSPAYVQRVADVFKNNGTGVRGDMTAVISAILLDPEARQGDDPNNVVSPPAVISRSRSSTWPALLARFRRVTDGSNLASDGGQMGQPRSFPGSVFNFYSPSYVITDRASSARNSRFSLPRRLLTA